ncbi:MAG: ATP-binding protein [Candidatus Bilamarchaeaceae archaeon]
MDTRLSTTSEENKCPRCHTPFVVERVQLGAKTYTFFIPACSCEKEADEKEFSDPYIAERESTKQRLLSALAGQAGPRLWREATWEGFVISPANAEMVAAVRRFQSNALPNCLVLSGPSGCGKTRLALIAARAEVERTCVRARFYNTTAFLRLLRGSFPSEQIEIIHEAKHAELLILDDLLPLSDHERVDLLELVDYRYRRERATIITTNIEVPKFDNAFGPQIASRILDKTWAGVACFTTRT